jgi:hypothetical protein
MIRMDYQHSTTIGRRLPQAKDRWANLLPRWTKRSGRALTPRYAMPTRPAALTDRARLQMSPGRAGAPFRDQRPAKGESLTSAAGTGALTIASAELARSRFG